MRIAVFLIVRRSAGQEEWVSSLVGKDVKLPDSGHVKISIPPARCRLEDIEAYFILPCTMSGIIRIMETTRPECA
jgi:hypothetical protein